MINTSVLNKVKSVLHLGACNCEESKIYKDFGIEKVLFVEANPEIKARNLFGYSLINYAIFNEDNKKVKFNLIYSDDRTNLGCSSLLNLKHHVKEYPHIKKVKEIECDTITIDKIIEQYGKFDLLNMDLQGAEKIALKGAKNTIQSFSYIYTEVSFTELYEGCVLFDELFKFLKSKNFKLKEIYKVTQSWGDALFKRIK